MAFVSSSTSNHLRLTRRSNSNLWRGPLHYRNRADAVLWATLDNPIAVRHVNQNVALTIEEPYDMKPLEHEATVLVEDALAVLEFADDLNRANLTTSYARVTRVLRQSQFALYPSRFRTGDVTGDALDFRVVETVHHNLVVGTKPAEMCTDRAGGATFRAA